jgi:hypothetical protein
LIIPQNSKRNTPEGSDTGAEGLSIAADNAIKEGQEASISRTDLRRRPVADAGEVFSAIIIG